jgi:MFS family permease
MSGAGSTARAFRERFFHALQYREFRLLWSANASAQAAAWALIVIRGWLVFEETDSSFWVGATTFAAMGPQFLVPPIIGVLADRIDRRTILLWTYTTNFLQSAVLLAIAVAGGLEVWVLVLFSLVNGTARAAQLPTSQAMAASLVPRESLLQALSLNASTQHGSRLIGPGLVTPLLSLAGAPAAFLVCTVLYGVGLFQIRQLTPREPTNNVQGSFFANFMSGLGYVYQRPVLRFMILLAIFHCGLTMAFESLLPSFASRDLGVESGGFGTLMIGVGIGSFIASVLISGVSTIRARGNTLIAMGLLSGLGQVMLSLTGTIWLALLAAAIMGGAQAAFMTMAQAVTQTIASDEFRGRVASINSFSLGGMMAVVNLLNGSLADYVGTAHLLFWEGAIFVIIVLLSLFVVSGRRIYGRAPAMEAQAA